MGQVKFRLYNNRKTSNPTICRLLESDQLRAFSDCKTHRDKSGSLVNQSTEFEVSKPFHLVIWI